MLHYLFYSTLKTYRKQKREGEERARLYLRPRKRETIVPAHSPSRVWKGLVGYIRKFKLKIVFDWKRKGNPLALSLRWYDIIVKSRHFKTTFQMSSSPWGEWLTSFSEMTSLPVKYNTLTQQRDLENLTWFLAYWGRPGWTPTKPSHGNSVSLTPRSCLLPWPPPFWLLLLIATRWHPYQLSSSLWSKGKKSTQVLDSSSVPSASV